MVLRAARAVTTLAAFVVALAPTPAFAGPADDAFLAAMPANDAGSGRDAGNVRALAEPLAAFGKYPGRLEQPDDVDWFAKRPQSLSDVPLCVAATLNAKTFADLTLVATSAAHTREVVVHGTPGKVARAALAFPASTEVLVGVAPAAVTAAAPPRPYDFTVTGVFAQDIVSDTGANGGDAGNSPDSAALVKGGCLAGILRGGEGDTADVFAFAGKPGDVVTLTLRDLANGTTRATLLSPDRVEVGTLPADGAPLVTELTSPGLWYVSVTSTSTGTSAFTLGMAIDPDPGQGCRPNC